MTETATESLAKRVESLPWVIYTDETRRDNADLAVCTRQRLVTIREEVHDIENVGGRVVAFSAGSNYGCKLYVQGA